MAVVNGAFDGGVTEAVPSEGVRYIRDQGDLGRDDGLPERVRRDAAQRVRVLDGLSVEAQRQLVLEPKKILFGVQGSIPPAALM